MNAESNVGIVFENDFGGAHILYRPQLEELLGNGEQLGLTNRFHLHGGMVFRWAVSDVICDPELRQLEGLSFVFINGCSSDS